MSELVVSTQSSGDQTILQFRGRLVTDQLSRFEAQVPKLQGPLSIDLTGIEAMDTGGAWVLSDLMDRVRDSGVEVQLRGCSEQHHALLETVKNAWPDERGTETPPGGLLVWVAAIGGATEGAARSGLSFVNFLGATLVALMFSLLRPWRLRWSAVVSQMQETGLNAVPIVVLMSFLIGVVLAFQGAAQLRQFGAEVFVVDLISVSILRELGILLTAIIVAGRSGSAFTAAIGSMKVREEIDAIRTLGLDPMDVLVVPRVLALVLMLPVLGLIANISGLLGGALMSWAELGVSPGMFITRLQDNTDVWHLLVGMIKAPFFAMMIGVVACWQAVQVGGSAESVGQRTTASVVQSIFLVIVLDAIFSIFFVQLGV